jgi:hypothetical protein
MKTIQKILTAALCLIVSAITVYTVHAQSNIKISSLPFNITAPGTYALTGDLTFSSLSQAGISISTAIPGPVVLAPEGTAITTTVLPQL